MDQQDIIQKTPEFVQKEFQNDSSGHDWWHIYRVWKNAITICKHEKADRFVIDRAALLHDLENMAFRYSARPDLRLDALPQNTRIDQVHRSRMRRGILG